jgi:hypothetical protein
MQDEIIKIIKKRLKPKSLVFTHEAQIDQGPVIILVMEIPLPENRRDIPGRFDHRVPDDGHTIVHRLKRRLQHATVGDETQNNNDGNTCEHIVS